MNFDLTSAVQMWASDPSTNHGIVLVSDSTDGTDIISSENGTYPKARPSLTVTYTLGDVPDTTEGDTGKDSDSGGSGGSGDSGKNSDTTEDTSTGDSGEANTDDSDTPPIGESPGEEASCGCLSVRPTSVSAWLLAGLAVAGWRRRRPLTEAA